MIRSSSGFNKTTSNFLSHNESSNHLSPTHSKRPAALHVDTFTTKHVRETSKMNILTHSPRNLSQTFRNTQTAMYSTLPTLSRTLVSPKALTLTMKDVDAFIQESKSAGFLPKDHMRAYNDTAKLETLFQKDYGTVKNLKIMKEDDDAEDVKRLDEWQHTLIRNQGPHIVLKHNTEQIEQFKSKGETKEKHDQPVVRQEIFDRIINDSDDENEGRRYGPREKLPGLIPEQGSFFKVDSPEFDTHGTIPILQSLEVMQRENNKEILNDLINKKIREYVRSVNTGLMTEEQLRVHVRKIAEGVVNQFKTLKGPAGSFILHDSVETIVKILQTNQEISKTLLMFSSAKENNVHEARPLDYEMTESDLHEKVNVASQDLEALKGKIKELTKECYILKTDIIHHQTQLDEHKKKHGLGTSGLNQDADRSNKNSQPRKRKSQIIDPTQIKNQMFRVEKYSELNELTRKLNEAHEKLSHKTQEIQLREKELENAQSQSEYCRTQLRDMYYKCMRDDQALMKDSKNMISYAWVVRALWNLDEEVKDHNFPSYLDPNSIKFMLEYATLQDELEEFCKDNNILNLTSSSEDFKCLLRNTENKKGHAHGQANLHKKFTSEFYGSIQSSYQDISDPNRKFKDRDFETMMIEVKEQMNNLKRVNLKAKRQVPVGKYSFKNKGVAYKWEDVDPTKIDKFLQLKVDPAVPSNHNEHKFRALKQDEQSKAVWDQGLDKIKTLSQMRKKEIDRIFKQYMPKDLDERLRTNLQKSFRFLFGKLGVESFNRFLKEKALYDQNSHGKAKKANLLLSTTMVTGGRASAFSSPTGPNRTPLPQAQFFTQESFTKDEAKEESKPMSPALKTAGSFFSQEFKVPTSAVSRMSKMDFQFGKDPMAESKVSWGGFLNNGMQESWRGASKQSAIGKRVNFAV